MRIAFLAVIYLGSLLFLSYCGNDPAIKGYAKRIEKLKPPPPPPRPTSDDKREWEAYCSYRDQHQRPLADFECVGFIFKHFVFTIWHSFIWSYSFSGFTLTSKTVYRDTRLTTRLQFNMIKTLSILVCIFSSIVQPTLSLIFCWKTRVISLTMIL